MVQLCDLGIPHGEGTNTIAPMGNAFESRITHVAYQQRIGHENQGGLGDARTQPAAGDAERNVSTRGGSDQDRYTLHAPSEPL